MASHLQGGRVDISLIQTSARNNLIELLEKCPGTKAIVWDNSLAGPVGLVAEYVMLREYSVRKMYPLRPIPLPETDVDHIIFISRPKLHLMDYIGTSLNGYVDPTFPVLLDRVFSFPSTDHKHFLEDSIWSIDMMDYFILAPRNVKDDAKDKHHSRKQYHLFFVPKKSLLCEEALKHQGVYGNMIFIEEFKCQLFPFDSDVVSMEIADVFRECTIENDPTYIYQTAQAIIFLQKLYGPIPSVWGKGVAAKQVWDLVTRLQREKDNSEDQPTNQVSCIDQIILIDRSVDLISPLATQLTYEGLIDEIFGINNATANFPIDNFLSREERSSESLSEDKKQVILNSADKLFADIRDKSFNAVPLYLAKQAKSITSQLENSQDKSVQEMKLYVQRLPQILAKKKQLALHTSIAECIKEHTDQYEFFDQLKAEQEFLSCFDVDKPSPYIEELMAQGKPLIQVLRLICLQCICSSGLRPKVMEGYKRELVQVYGLSALLAITKLEKVGLLKLQSNYNRQYTVLRKTLRLIMEDTSEINPTDICYVHSIYAPLSVRLAEQVTKSGGWKQLHDVLGLLPGPTLDVSPVIASNVIQNYDTPKVVLVFFIGGCTFAEISALRFLSQQEDSNVEFVIATTKLINGNTFLKSIIEG